MPKKPLPSFELLHSLLHYDPETGELSRKSDGKIFKTYQDNAYIAVSIEGINYVAHRIIWKMMYGYDPQVIDHRNGQKSDNRACNIRDCTSQENSCNYLRKAPTKTNIQGVHEENGKYRARIRVNGKLKSWGSYGTIEEAIAARHAAEIAERGEFAPHLSRI